MEPVARFAMDYGYLNRRDHEDSEETDRPGDSPMLVMVEEESEFPLAYPLAKKGVVDNDWLIQMITSEIETLGFGGLEVILKSDQEYAIVALKEALQGF